MVLVSVISYAICNPLEKMTCTRCRKVPAFHLEARMAVEACYRARKKRRLSRTCSACAPRAREPYVVAAFCSGNGGAALQVCSIRMLEMDWFHTIQCFGQFSVFKFNASKCVFIFKVLVLKISVKNPIFRYSNWSLKRCHFVLGSFNITKEIISLLNVCSAKYSSWNLRGFFKKVFKNRTHINITTLKRGLSKLIVLSPGFTIG